jgi:hypothetical protein
VGAAAPHHQPATIDHGRIARCPSSGGKSTNHRIRFEWGDDKPTTVELRFTPWGDGATYVEATEAGLSGDGDEILARVADSTGGFTIVLCALKALLEHGLVLTVVRDAHPKGLQP